MLRNIPASKTIKEAAEKSGYKSQHIYSKSFKAKLKTDLEKLGFSKEAIIREFDLIKEEARAEKDFSNVHRGLENIAKLRGFSDKETQNVVPLSLTFHSDADKSIRSRIKQSIDEVDGSIDEHDDKNGDEQKDADKPK